MITVELVGFQNLKSKFTRMGLEFNSATVRDILDEPARVLLSDAKAKTRFYGEIGEDFKKDLAVQRDRKDERAVLVGPRFRPYKIRGRDEKVAVIAQHITEGFRQTDRPDRRGRKHGRVLNRFDNPVKNALRDKSTQLKGLVDTGINKKILKMKTKYGL